MSVTANNRGGNVSSPCDVVCGCGGNPPSTFCGRPVPTTQLMTVLIHIIIHQAPHFYYPLHIIW